jgi:uroporphyrin-III C-methyltransferase/precorrin-2 dehydrogenase/sirohydrochlorin ferrochelatase
MSDARKLGIFPAFHKVSGRRVVVIGGGAEAAAKIRLLRETDAKIVVFAPSLDSAAGADVVAAHGEWRAASSTVEDIAGAALVFIATGSEDGDRAALARAPQAGVPANVVDRPHL